MVKSIWKTQVDWNESIPDEQAKLWLNYLEDLKSIEKNEIRRRYFAEPGAGSFELHIFGDAEAVAYVAVIWKM